MFKQDEKAVCNQDGYWMFGAVSSKNGNTYSVRRSDKDSRKTRAKGFHLTQHVAVGTEGESLFKPEEAVPILDAFLEELHEKEARLKEAWRHAVAQYNEERWKIGYMRACARQTKRTTLEYLNQIKDLVGEDNK